MIKELKRRFITLATVSLIVLISGIVAGMNIMNFNSVVSNADSTIEMISENQGRLPIYYGYDVDDIFDDIDDLIFNYYGGNEDYDGDTDYDDIESDTDDYSRHRFTPGGRAPRGFSRDEAEETRYFTVLVNSYGTAVGINTDRIYAVDQDQAATLAEKIVASGKTRGFIGDYRYAAIDESGYTRVTFLDCGRSLDNFRDFLKASILMSVVGLLAVFAVICYFAGRIVKPVAESYEKQKRFITDAGHEIKTPLAIIKANIDVMKMDLEDIGEAVNTDEGDAADSTAAEPLENVKELTGSLNESLSDIDGQVDRLTTLTSDLVYLSRMEEGDNKPTMTEIPVSDIVYETAEPFSALAQERSKVLDLDITPMLSMQGSTKEIEKLVSILLENAIKYSPKGDTVHLSLDKEGKNIVLEVRNKTLGPVTDDDLAHVFERFYRTDKSRNSEAGGHGIGLSMASAIVSLHNGKIRARSGDGTEFIVTATMPAL